ncbi:sensor domain-containing diguanylate cyclase [Aliidiomarina taiwanensis]|uniref:Sensor domain-containing diguanylate cyclase n=1 Tax=Aliidiomarina taiwanensis TaxID=946228 RepID=A0A432X7K5_9GAMM|nr:GGDEF domain-containing phosphodiesterase [Aliidiomarina taiwanensis]RUO42812.1 sensor domain-containing diguanylate cyclase [Aliidiomarina taiwanensis]
MQGCRFNSKSLLNQIVAIVLLLGSATIMMSALYLTHEQVESSHEHIKRELQTLMGLTQGAMNRSFRYQKIPAVEEIISELKAHRRVKEAALFTQAGEQRVNVLGEAQVKSLTSMFPQSSEEVFLASIQQQNLKIQHVTKTDSYLAYIPIKTVPDALAEPEYQVFVVEYMLPITWADAFVYKLPLIGGWAFILLLILTISIAYLNHRVVQPAQALVRNITRAVHHQLDQLESVRGASELTEINQALNSMLAERNANEERLIKLSTAIEQSSEGVVITDHQARIEYVNQSMVNNTGYSREQLIGSDPKILSSGKTPRSTFTALWARLNEGKSWTGELYNKRADGSEFVELQTITPLKNSAGEVTHFVGVRQDITEQKAIQERLHFLAYNDSLTHLPNRTSTMERLQRYIDGAHARGAYGAVLLINIDRFKVINDARGFQFGNEVITKLSMRLRKLKSSGIRLSHFGADTFCFIMKPERMEKQDMRAKALVLAEDVLNLCSKPICIEEQDVSITVSIGIRLLDSTETPEGLLRSAETALHTAKDLGGNQIFNYRHEDGRRAEYIFLIEHELREALREEQLECYLQAQVDETGALAGAETLVRWHHPVRGLVSPGDFIPVAERSDLIKQLDMWVLERSLEFLSGWQQQQRDLTIAVNISPRTLRSKHFVTEVLTAIERAGANSCGLVLEITEGLVVEDLSGSIEKMKALQTHGVQFSIDDFGTGYSSLTYIRELPAQELKIDQSFIRGVPESKADIAMIESILTVAKNLRIRVLAEGIETAEQAEFCKQRNMWGQGYYYDKPKPHADWCEAWLSHEG